MVQEFAIGAIVRLTKELPYVKTAEPKPMLRPGAIVEVGEEGTVVGCYPGGFWGVKFERGVFLMDAENLEEVMQ